MMKTTVISLGGSIIVPDKVDIDFLKRFKRLVLDYVKRGNRMIIVTGGGSTCRIYQNASAELAKATNTDKDWIGIMATRLNAELVRVMFKEDAYQKVVYNPHEKIKTDKKIIVGAGYEPGCSTDTDTVILAKQFDADLVINTTNVDYVYDKDPARFKDAKKIEQISWPEYKRMIGGKFKPGMHAPFDPVASRIAMQSKMKVAIVNGRKLDNLNNLLDEKRFIGTLIG
ncbi:MAG: UMP kinase [Nanoarchaeota archaeon]|nr:UMP kinase [Nanoarchaeota archaeon]